MKLQAPQHGLSMIEVLVGLFILAIGIMGQMALQMTSLTSSQSSYYRSQAASIANDLADRVRLNPNGAAHDTTNYDDVSIDPDSNNTAPSCTGGCNHADQVRLDIYEIQQTLHNSIPGGSLELEAIAITDVASPNFRITINWAADEDRVGLANSDELNQLVMDFGI